MGFLDELNSIIRNDTKTFGYEQDQFMIKTGFDSIDYLNGQITLNDNGDQVENLGIDAGKIVTIIGKSGSGKSTLALQIAYNIMKKYEQSTMFVLDFEQSNSKDRIRGVTGMSEEYYNQHVTLKKTGISTETVLKIVSQIKKLKKEHEKELLVENQEGILDENGKPMKILPPTIVMVDSIAMMMPEALLSEEEMAGQMSATAMAKANTQLFKRLVQPCQDANIIMLFINHINQKISTGPMPTQAQVNFLGQDETLPGGNAPIYLTNTLIKIVTSTKLTPEKGYGIKGFEANIMLVKSRTAPAGRSVTMIYDQREGFDQDLSILDYIKSNGGLKGNGMAYYIEGYDAQKFRMSNFKEKLAENAEFREHFYNFGKALMRASISVSSKFEIKEDNFDSNIGEE